MTKQQRELRDLGLIIMLYDYKPNFKENGIEVKYEGNHIPVWSVLGITVELLTHNKYFTDSRPNDNLYALLDKYGVTIKQLEQGQAEWRKKHNV